MTAMTDSNPSQGTGSSSPTLADSIYQGMVQDSVQNGMGIAAVGLYSAIGMIGNYIGALQQLEGVCAQLASLMAEITMDYSNQENEMLQADYEKLEHDHPPDYYVGETSDEDDPPPEGGWSDPNSDWNKPLSQDNVNNLNADAQAQINLDQAQYNTDQTTMNNVISTAQSQTEMFQNQVSSVGQSLTTDLQNLQQLMQVMSTLTSDLHS